MRVLRSALSTLVAMAIGIKFLTGTATPQVLFSYLLLVAVLVLVPGLMIDAESRLDRREAATFVTTTVLASGWLLAFDGGPSGLPWVPFGLAWVTGLASLLVAVRVKRRDGGVVSGEVLEALAGWPAMRQFNNSVTAPATAPDLRPPDLRVAAADAGPGPDGHWSLPAAGSARRRLREQGVIGRTEQAGDRPVRPAARRSVG